MPKEYINPDSLFRSLEDGFLRSSSPMAARQSTFRAKLPGTHKGKSSAEQIWLNKPGKPCAMFRPLLKLLVARWQT